MNMKIVLIQAIISLMDRTFLYNVLSANKNDMIDIKVSSEKPFIIS